MFINNCWTWNGQKRILIFIYITFSLFYSLLFPIWSWYLLLAQSLSRPVKPNLKEWVWWCCPVFLRCWGLCSVHPCQPYPGWAGLSIDLGQKMAELAEGPEESDCSVWLWVQSRDRNETNRNSAGRCGWWANSGPRPRLQLQHAHVDGWSIHQSCSHCEV